MIGGTIIGGGLRSLVATSSYVALDKTIRVGRWMSRTEYEKMLDSGFVQESQSGTTHVLRPAQPEAYLSQAKPGSYYAEFNVPANSLKQTGEGWSKIIGPNSLEDRIAAKKGNPVPQMPKAKDISHKATKLKK